MQHPASTRPAPAATAPPARRAAATAAAQRRDVPVLLFRAAVLLVLGFLLSGPGGLVHLSAPLASTGTAAELHRWHATDIAALVSLVVSGSLALSALRPRQSVVLVQAVLLSLVGFAALGLVSPSAGAILPPVAIVLGLVLATHPERRAVLRLPRRVGGDRAALLAAVVATPFLVANLAQNLARQLADAGEHALLGHWSGAAALALALLVSCWLAASGGRGARALSGVVALTCAYLGVAALLLPQHDGSWGTTGAVVGLAVAGASLVAALRPAPRRDGGRR